jgi:hypothetical protein
MSTRHVPGPPAPRVRGLALPPLLAGLIASGRWQHPGDDGMLAALPWFEDPVVFLSSAQAMESASQSLDMDAGDEGYSRLFRIARGSVAGPVRSPRLDAELSVFIAVNRNPGDDVAVALTTAAMRETPRWSLVTSGLIRPAASGGRPAPLSRRLPRCWASCRRDQWLSGRDLTGQPGCGRNSGWTASTAMWAGPGTSASSRIPRIPARRTR